MIELRDYQKKAVRLNLLYLLKRLQPRKTRHHLVEQDEVVGGVGTLVNGVGAVAHGVHLIAFFL